VQPLGGQNGSRFDRCRPIGNKWANEGAEFIDAHDSINYCRRSVDRVGMKKQCKATTYFSRGHVHCTQFVGAQCVTERESRRIVSFR